MIVHIDCNSFFASCETAFRPELKGRPVVVANGGGGNSGIILALTPEAKAAGLRRGMPVFKSRDIIERHGVCVFGADMQKYHDTSERIMRLVMEQGIVQNFVQYSIDEFFGTLPVDDRAEAVHYVGLVRDLIAGRTDVPVACGCSTTYTLSKVATWYAKRYPGYRGICVLQPKDVDKALSGMPVGDVWGIGRANRRFLSLSGIATAADFARMPESIVRKKMQTAGARTWRELHGTRAIEIERRHPQQSITQSRTFAAMTNSHEQLRSMLAAFVTGIAHRMREQKRMCGSVEVFLSTNRHRLDLPQYYNVDIERLTMPTQDTGEMIGVATRLLDRIYAPGFMFKKMGVMLGHLSDSTAVQLDLFDHRDMDRSRKLMEAVDSINNKYGMQTVRSALASEQHIGRNLLGFQSKGSRPPRPDAPEPDGDDEPASGCDEP